MKVPTSRVAVAPLPVMLSMLLLGFVATASAEDFQVEVISGSTVSVVSGNGRGDLREVVTRADPNPPPPEPEFDEEEDERPDPVVVIVKPEPPRYYERRGVVVHSSIDRPHHHRPHPRAKRSRGAGRPVARPGSSVNGGGMLGVPRP